MTSLRYHIATISYCYDLVDPESETVPVGAFLVADIGDRALAYLVMRRVPDLDDSPDVIREMAEDYPDLLQAELDHCLRTCGATSIEDIMRLFEELLQNSFYVSHIEWNQTVEVLPQPDALEEGAWLQVGRSVGDAFGTWPPGLTVRRNTWRPAPERAHAPHVSA